MNPDTTPEEAVRKEIWLWDGEIGKYKKVEQVEAHAPEETITKDCTLKLQRTPNTPFKIERLEQKIRNMQEIIDDDTKQKTELHNEVARLRELLERICDSVSENWDEGIANYFREEANKPHN